MPRGVSRLDEALIQRRLWTPQAIEPDLRLWLDAAALPTMTIDGSAGVSPWTSGNRSGAQFVQNTAGQRPVWSADGLRGRPVVNYSGGRRMGMAADLALGGLGVFECVAVLTMASGTATNGRFFSFLPNGGDDFSGSSGIVLISRDGSSNALLVFHAGAGRGSTAISLDTPLIFRVSSDGTTVRSFLNGAQTASATVTPALGTGVFATGFFTYAGSTADWVGLKSEVVFAAARNVGPLIEGHLSWKWGIPLAAGHPYRNAPPLIGG